MNIYDVYFYQINIIKLKVFLNIVIIKFSLMQTINILKIFLLEESIWQQILKTYAFEKCLNIDHFIQNLIPNEDKYLLHITFNWYLLNVKIIVYRVFLMLCYKLETYIHRYNLELSKVRSFKIIFSWYNYFYKLDICFV